MKHFAELDPIIGRPPYEPIRAASPDLPTTPGTAPVQYSSRVDSYGENLKRGRSGPKFRYVVG